MPSPWLAAVVASALLIGCATLPRPARSLDYKAEGGLIGFANGLTVLVAPDPDTTLVQVDLHVRTGSSAEPPERAGLAHFAEHLLFRLRPDGTPIARRLADLVLTYNAFTSHDTTHFVSTGFPSALTGVVAVYRDILAGDCSTLSAAELARERHVVLSEQRVRTGELFDLVSAIYPPDHPYGHSIGGTLETVAALTRDDACAFILSHYAPANATIVVAGAVTQAEVQSAVEPLRSLPRREAPQAPAIAPWRPVEARRALSVSDDSSAVVVVLPFPPRFDAREMAARELSFAIQLALLGLQEQTKGILEATAEIAGGERAPVLIVRASHASDASERAEAYLWQAIALAPDLIKAGIFHQIARQQMRVEVVENMDRLAQRGALFATYLGAPPGYGFMLGDLQRIDNVDYAAVDATMASFFRKDYALTLELSPGRKRSGPLVRVPQVGKVEAHDEWTVDDDAGELAALANLPDARSRTHSYSLANGLRVLLIPNSSLPIVDVSMIVHAGMDHAPAGQPLVPLLAAHLAKPDANKRSFHTADANFTLVGGYVEASVRRNSTVFATRGLSMYVDYLLLGLANEVLAADYSNTSVAGLRSALARARNLERTGLRRLQLSERLTRVVSQRARTSCAAALDIDTMRATDITARDLARFKAQHYAADNATLVVSGNFDVDLVRAHIDADFGGGKPRAADDDHKRTGRVRFPDEPFVPRVTPAPDRTQVEVALAFALPKAVIRDPAARALITAIVGDAVGRVRDTGASYGFQAAHRNVCGVDMLTIVGDVEPARAEEAMRVLHGALQSLRAGQELARPIARARRVAVRNLFAAASEARAVAAGVAAGIEYGADHQDVRAAAEQAARFPAAEIAKVLADTLRLERAEMVCIGPATAAAAACAVEPRGVVIDPFAEPDPAPALAPAAAP